MSEASDEVLAIRVVMMPRDTNAHGTIFGGQLLSLIDQAGAIAAHARGGGRLVTVAMDRIVFKQPVHVGDLVTCYARVVRIGRTSVTCGVRVTAFLPGVPGPQSEPREVTQAEVVYVNTDPSGVPIPIVPPSG